MKLSHQYSGARDLDKQYVTFNRAQNGRSVGALWEREEEGNTYPNGWLEALFIGRTSATMGPIERNRAEPQRGRIWSKS